MGKITNFKIIDKKTIELLSDAKKGDQIDLSIKQSIDFSNLDLSNEKDKQIAELSKKGYQLLKENNIEGAKEAFNCYFCS